MTTSSTSAPLSDPLVQVRGVTLRRGVRWLLPLAGVVVGVVTLLAQGSWDAPWLALVNSASSWLVVAFAVGYAQPGVGSAALLGLVTCLGELAAYYAAAAARGFGASTAWVLFWFGGAVVGGPLFGALGRLARGDRSRLAVAFAATAPAATFVGEGVGSYWLRLGQGREAVLLVVLGLAAGAVAVARLPGRAVALAALGVGALAGVTAYGLVYGGAGWVASGLATLTG